MRFQHTILVLFIAAAWGINFIFIRIGLEEIPPFLLCAIRFFFCAVPAIFFIKKPNIKFKWLILYGMFAFGLQFSFLFIGMRCGMAPGLASLLTQVQVFFSVLFAALFLKETLNTWHLLAFCIAFTGIAVVWMHLSGEASFLGFVCIILAAAALGISNVITKKLGPVNGIALVVWGSMIACPVLFVLSFSFEEPLPILFHMQQLSTLTIFAIFYIVAISTWFGYGAWNWLLSQYPLSTIAPFTLLVPIFGILSAALLFDEPMQSWKKIATIFVMTGLCIHSIAQKISAKDKLSMLA